jgi:hypothetical protein
MYESLSYFDLTLLLNKGFKFGIADSVLWGTDDFGTEWHAIVDGQWIYFAERLPSGNTLGQRTMKHTEFRQLFS